MSAFELLPLIVVHCMFCPDTVQGFDPVLAHEQMEDHYTAEHQARIDELIGMLQ